LVESRDLRDHANAIAAGEMIRGFGQKPVQPADYAVRILLKRIDEARSDIDRLPRRLEGRPVLSTGGMETILDTLIQIEE
jgi:hypothetical protein